MCKRNGLAIKPKGTDVSLKQKETSLSLNRKELACVMSTEILSLFNNYRN